MGNRNAIIGLALALGLSIGGVGCGLAQNYEDKHGTGDAGVGDRDDSDKDVINFPDNFANVAHACDGYGHRVYVTTHTNQAKQLFVIDDPSCKRGG